MTEITKDTVIGDILDICPDAAPYFLQDGLCTATASARHFSGETVEQAFAPSAWRRYRRSAGADQCSDPEMIGLTPRLQAVADMVPPGCADGRILAVSHGYVSAYLVQQGIAPRVVAADVRPGPLGACRRLVEELGLTFQIQTRLCSGLTDIVRNARCDAVILAGMGGELIADRYLIRLPVYT